MPVARLTLAALCAAALSFPVLAPPVRAASLEVGQMAPNFSLPDQNGRIHQLSADHGKTVILAFYPKDFTGG